MNQLSRRDFFKLSGIAGAGLVIGIGLPEIGAQPAQAARTDAAPFEPNAFIRIDADGTVTLTVSKSEMGQGARTALPMILAEELEVDFAAVRVEQALADQARYGNQHTAGSSTIRSMYVPLRQAGAMAREILILAAASTWNVDPQSYYADKGAVIHTGDNRQLTYGELVQTASALPLPRPNAVKLKDPKDFKIVGTPIQRVDNARIVEGSAIFGLDVRVPDMLYAVVARCPVYGGSVASFDDTAARAVQGVSQVVRIDSGIAVVADNTWSALEGRKGLHIQWNEGPNATLNSEAIRQMLAEQVPQVQGPHSAVYQLPYLAHAPMEPMNCVADVRSDHCEVWAPTQDPGSAQRAAQSVAGVPATVHVTLLGGGFGRKSGTDFVTEAVQVSKAIGKPVKLVWTRDDDIPRGYYRPISYHALQATLGDNGLPASWKHDIASPSIFGEAFMMTEGAANLPYSFETKVTPHVVNIPIPTTFWRAVYNGQNAFVNESFLDELAAAGKVDPYQMHLALLKDGSPLKEVLKLAASKTAWGSPVAEGRGRGIACHTYSGTHVAEVAEVSVAQNGSVHVERVVCAVDCGLPINPDMIQQQVEGAIVYGLTAALKGEITIKDGRAQQSTFADYPLLRMNEMPTIEVYIVPSQREPMGVGEMAVPPIAPAVANAVFAATGKRIRHLPIRAQDLAG